MRFHVHHTHLYPGARLTALDGPKAPAGDVILEFSDGAGSVGHYQSFADGSLTLDVAPYRTVAGTQLPAKHWRLKPTGERGIWCVEKKLDADL
ncbi:hypothetical protein PI93_009800 [Pandoraea fibrosis]|uniref:Uncharacterized protein n=1 Tax=Pandoraea fibrosis TaxID=1891094 RepID=A0ABX6HPS6_9BURK|nr:hypothetical protein [Pandoraea fibrosis]QHE93542.1 hypothetical protein PJ20_018195 [Pandoraea fibrosis]QHF12896.1 hypothetical protein PI93_009800 [Pandoraea fibrosis]